MMSEKGGNDRLMELMSEQVGDDRSRDDEFRISTKEQRYINPDDR